MFWCTNCIERRLRCVRFLSEQYRQCLRFLPTVSYALAFVFLTCGLKFASANYNRVCFSLLVMLLFLLLVLSRTFSVLLLIVDDLGEELGGNCVVTQDTIVRRLMEVKRILRRFQINHKH